MSTSDDHERTAEKKQYQIRLAKALLEEGHSVGEAARQMKISVSSLRLLMTEEINWSYNCLTGGVHNGRPEAIWNLPLFQAAYMFRKDQLQELVIARIYNDAMLIHEHGDKSRYSQEWADRIKELAEERYLNTLKVKIGEISRYYQSPEWELEQHGVVELIKENKLNSNYAPLHPHDTINLLCRILGVGCDQTVSKELNSGT